MKPQTPSSVVPHANSSMASRAKYKNGDTKIQVADSCRHFSRSEMAAAEQLVQLSDHSDASSNTANSAVDEGRGEICSSAAKITIDEIFGGFDDEEEEDLRRRKKKYGSLAQIYKNTKPLIIQYGREAKKAKPTPS